MSTSTQPSPLWPTLAYSIHAAADAAISRGTELAAIVYERVCRTGFDAPGFYLIDLSPKTSSESLRQVMLSLNDGLRDIHRDHAARDLVFLSAGRFDQRVTTKLHRDGGPDECFLMLGYEPSEVVAEIAIADYAKCAHDMGLSAGEFLDHHNPDVRRRRGPSSTVHNALGIVLEPELSDPAGKQQHRSSCSGRNYLAGRAAHSDDPQPVAVGSPHREFDHDWVGAAGSGRTAHSRRNRRIPDHVAGSPARIRSARASR